MIPEGAPSFIVLVIASGMVGIMIAILNYLQNRGLHTYRMFRRICPNFLIFHYILVTIILYLAAQILAFLKIILHVAYLDSIIMYIFLVGNAAIITFLFWIYHFSVREPLPSPAATIAEKKLNALQDIKEIVEQIKSKDCDELS